MGHGRQNAEVRGRTRGNSALVGSLPINHNRLESIENSTGYVCLHLHNITFTLRSMDSVYDIPTHCKAGVVVNEGPDFQVKVEMVPVPEPGASPRAII
jgi:hypothetical protein